MYICCFMYYWMSKSRQLPCWYQVGEHASYMHLLQRDSSETAMQHLNVRSFLRAGARRYTELCLFWKDFLLICTKSITHRGNSDVVYLYPRWCEAASLLLGCEKLKRAGSFVRNSRLSPNQVVLFLFWSFSTFCTWKAFGELHADESASPSRAGKQAQAWLESASGSCFS